MDIIVSRFNSTDKSTVSDVYVDDQKFCFMLEDPVREQRDGAGGWIWKPEFKIPGDTAIPSGEYSVIVTESARFKRKLPLLLNVPDFTGVRIHPGNHPGNTEGCLLPGLRWSSSVPDWVSSSRKAFMPLYVLILEAFNDGQEVRVTVQNEF